MLICDSGHRVVLACDVFAMTMAKRGILSGGCSLSRDVALGVFGNAQHFGDWEA
jgi:hypothetical protein